MTAQNMGKKILTDAGYEVVAVSNGAAAVKKIAEQKPDIIILDVYMPGYSGLEVCEKVRASIETMKTPVLLTVGKMEPYKPEDATRVRADGVIIKPFEASLLLATVKKLEERIVPKAPPIAEQTILLDRPPDFSEFEHEFHAEPHPEERSTAQPMISMSDEMASSAAFGDLLGMDMHETPAPAVVVTPPPPPPAPPAAIHIDAPMSSEFEVKAADAGHHAEPEPPAPVAMEAPVSRELEVPPPSFEESPSPGQAAPVESAPIEPEPAPYLEAPAVVSAISAIAPEPALITHEPPPEVRHIDVAPDPAFEVPITPASIDVPVATEPALQPTSQPAAEIWNGRTDPALVTDVTAMNSFPTKFGVDNPEEVPVGIAADVPELQATEVMPAMEAAPEPVAAAVAPPAYTVSPAVSEDDFEARVARAMSVYEQSMEAEIAAEKEPPPAEVTPPVVQAEPEPVVEPMRAPEPAYIPAIHAVPAKIAAVAAEPEPVPPPPAIISMPPVAPPEPVPAVVAPPEPVAVVEPPVAPEPPAVMPEPAAEVARQVAAHIEAEIPATATAATAAAGGDNHMVATVVHRVMERLKPELIEEIMRELKDKK